MVKEKIMPSGLRSKYLTKNTETYCRITEKK